MIQLQIGSLIRHRSCGFLVRVTAGERNQDGTYGIAGDCQPSNKHATFPEESLDDWELVEPYREEKQ